MNNWTDLFDPRHLLPLLFIVPFLLLSSLVQPANETLLAPLMLEAIFVVCARGRVVRDEDLAVFAEVLLVGDPKFALRTGEYKSGYRVRDKRVAYHIAVDVKAQVKAQTADIPPK